MVWDQDFHKKNNQATLNLEDIPLPIIYRFDNKICLNQVQGKGVKVITSDHRPNTCEFMPWYPPQILKFPDTSTNTRNFPHISSSPIKCSSHQIVEKLMKATINTCITKPNSHKPGFGFPMSYVVVFFLCLFNDLRWEVIVWFVDIGGIFVFVQWFKMRGDCLVCWYWWYCLPSLFILPFHKDIKTKIFFVRRVWRYQRGNQNQ